MLSFVIDDKHYRLSAHGIRSRSSAVMLEISPLVAGGLARLLGLLPTLLLQLLALLLQLLQPLQAVTLRVDAPVRAETGSHEGDHDDNDYDGHKQRPGYLQRVRVLHAASGGRGNLIGIIPTDSRQPR
jgi:hypothetical protein